MDIADKMNKTKYNYIYRNSHQLISSFGKDKSFKKLNSFKENPSLQKILCFLKYSRNKRNKNRTK